jgi:hypothetical protein
MTEFVGLLMVKMTYPGTIPEPTTIDRLDTTFLIL